jgi:hypothetical protein
MREWPKGLRHSRTSAGGIGAISTVVTAVANAAEDGAVLAFMRISLDQTCVKI